MQTRLTPSLSALRRMAEHADLPNWENLSKHVLHKRLQEQFNIDRLQRASRRNLNGKRKRKEKGEDEKEKGNESSDPTDQKMSHCKRRKNRKNSPEQPKKEDRFDPIMRCPLGKHVYTFLRPNGSCTSFNVESLVDYLLSSGDFTDPESRLPFSDDDLKMIDKSAEKAGLKKKSVFAAKTTPENIAYYADKSFHRDALLGLERCAGEVVTEMRTIIEDCEPEEAEMRLLMREFPSFAEYYGQLKEADADYARHSMATWRLYLNGPPNRPTVDPYGVLPVVQMFLRRCEAGTFNIFP